MLTGSRDPISGVTVFLQPIEGCEPCHLEQEVEATTMAFGGGSPAAPMTDAAYAAIPAWSSRMIVPRSPLARSPGPRGPDRSSPTGGSIPRASLLAGDI